MAKVIWKAKGLLGVKILTMHFPRNLAKVALTALVLSQFALAKPALREEGALVFDGIPPIPATLKERLHQYNETRNATVVGWNPSEKGILITTRFGNTSQLHRVHQAGGARYQLTFDNEPLAGVQVRPIRSKSRGVLLSQDQGGGEFFQLFYLDLDTGVRQRLSDGRSRYSAALWSPSGNSIACASTERNGKDTDVTLITLDGKRRTLTREEGSWQPVAWSQDETTLLIRNYKSIADSRLYLLDIDSGKLRPIDSNPEPVAHGTGVLTDDGHVIYTSDRNSEFLHLRSLDPISGEDIALTPNLKWNVEALEINPAGDRIIYSVNEAGLSSVYSWHEDQQAPEKLPLEQGIAWGFHFSPDGDSLAFTFDSGKAPAEAYTFDFKTAELERWTESEVGGLNPDSFVAPQLVTFPSFDGKEISAFYFHPQKTTGRVPSVILIHGGPESQYTPNFSSLVQFLTNELGIAVLAPNVRGSDGYGKTFLSLDNGFLREDSVKDIGALLDWIAQQPNLDKDRVAVQGGSYGGYMVLASLTHYSDRLRAGIDVVGISNFVTFLKNTQEYRRDLRRAEYGDERDPAMLAHLEKISPLNNVAKINVPLLVVQGLNDPRVPTSEAEQIVKAVRKQGKECWYLLAKDEGHGFKKKGNRDAYLQTLALFLETHLLK